MSVSAGFTPEEIRGLVHEYQVQPQGQKGRWLAARGLTYDRMQRWRTIVFEGDLERGLVPRAGTGTTIPQGQRTGLEKERARERAAHEAEVARLNKRVQELEEANDVLGKAIGLLHKLNEEEPAETPKTTGPADS